MKEQQIYIDIGGGTNPDFFLGQSEINRQSQYIVLDPTTRAVPNKPNNLHLLKWQCDNRCDLPFGDKTIDGIYLNNLFDELRTDGCQLDWSDTVNVFEEGYGDSNEILNPDLQKELYGKILKSSKRVLKPGGTIIITDSSENILNVLALCINHGFSILVEPQIVQDSNKSLWTKWFYDLYTMLEDYEGKYDAAPTEFAAQLVV